MANAVFRAAARLAASALPHASCTADSSAAQEKFQKNSTQKTSVKMKETAPEIASSYNVPASCPRFRTKRVSKEQLAEAYLEIESH